MLTTDFKNYVRDLIVTNISTGKLGTDDTAESETDTDLVSSVSATSLAVTKRTFNKGYSVDYVLPSGTGNGYTYKEFGIFLSDGTLHSRVTMYDFEKTSDSELTISQVVTIE